jgi:hypothetical protein
MESNVYFWWALLVIYVGTVIISAVKALRKGGIKRFKYDLKLSWNDLTILLDLIIGLYVMIVGMIPMSYIKIWVINNINSPVPWMRPSVPAVYLLIITLVAILIIARGLVPKIKYNDEEKQWDKERRERNKNRIRQWLHIKPKNMTE